ncbi:MAG: extracellular solute-binding protein [Anaerolineae bacterium]|nr:extracellular solute-binding protein [Anaerolineae bacterium]
MNHINNKRVFWLLLAVFTLVLAACSGGETTATAVPATTASQEEAAPTEEPMEEETTSDSGINEITIFWAQWDPADYLQEIGNMYEEETGVKVNVVQEPWGSFGDVFFAEMAAQGTSYDMVIGDSQWLGQATTQGHYVNLTDFMNSEGLTDSVTDATLTYYGEYPPRLRHLLVIPHRR